MIWIRPEILLLLPPALLLTWWWARGIGPGLPLRLLVVLLLLLATAGPALHWGHGGSDVVLVLDRSQSMAEARDGHEELLRLVAEQRGRDDRLAVVGIGAEARVIQGPQTTGLTELRDDALDPSGSDLAGALIRADGLIAPGRSGRVLLVSDGEATDADPRRVVAQLRQRDLVLDTLAHLRPDVPDAAIIDIQVPERLRQGMSFLGTVQVQANRACRRELVVERDGVELRRQELRLSAHRSIDISFADRPVAGIAQYRIRLDGGPDSRPGNDQATAVIRVRGGEQVLVIGSDGQAGNVAAALQAAGMPVRRLPAGSPGLAELTACQAVVLDQVSAQELGHDGMRRLATWVQELGGGLLVGGGQRALGSGGYHRSPLDPILPVSLELRDEHRRLSLAMAMALDRSGSMGAPLQGGTKMDLANRGAVAATELLSSLDEVAVFAVDSAPHTIVSRRRVDNKAAIIDDILSIDSGGGGIFVYEALAAAAEAVLGSDRSTRHIVLFADAADAEQPGDYRQLLADLQTTGVNVSVIGLGTNGDVDAELLRDIAKRGGGRCVFTTDAVELPRLFAHETMLVARTTWDNQPCAVQAEPGLELLLGTGLPLPTWPQWDGHNVTWARDRATVLATCQADPRVPAAAAWYIGSGRCAVIATALDEAALSSFPAWPGYAPFLSSLCRWTASDEQDEIGRLSSRRQGRDLIIDLELDPAQRDQWQDELPLIRLIDAHGQVHDTTARQLDEHHWQARSRLRDDRVWLPVARLGSRSLSGGAICLPYAPEHAPRYGQTDGKQVLQELSLAGGGSLREDLHGVFDNPPSPGQFRNLSTWLLIAALVLLVAEIAIRRCRLQLLPRLLRMTWQRRSLASSTKTKTAAERLPDNETDAPRSEADLHNALQQLRRKKQR